MTYQVIARKWRPQTFEEVTGKEHITRTLRNAVEHERLHHAYLFSGARGVGKTTTARLLAKAVNCHKADKPTPTPCRITDADVCPSCREIAEGRSIDVLEIDAASNTGVDNVREAIINTVGIRPARDRYKVFIIDEVHMLSPAAFNALLKTLEEPPPRVLFIMATTHPHKVPATILSRSQHLRNFCRDLLAHLRDLLVFKVAGDSALSDATEAERRELHTQAREFSESDIVRFFHSLTETERQLREGAHPRYQLEVGLVKLVEMRRLAPLGQIVERLSALEESLRTGRAPAGGAGTPNAPTSPANLPPRRGMAGGGGASSFSPGDSSAAAPAGNFTTKRDESKSADGAAASEATVEAATSEASDTAARARSHTQTAEGRAQHHTQNADGHTQSDAARTQAHANNARAQDNADSSPAASHVAARPNSPPNLKLVPPPAPSSGGAPSFSGDAATRAADAPFALSNDEGADASARGLTEQPFFVETRAGEDRVGQPVSLVTASSSGGAGAAPAHAEERAADEPCDDAGRIKRGLEERGKPLLAAALEGARRVVVEGDEGRVEFAPEGRNRRATLKRPENMRLLREVCCEVLGRGVGVGFAMRS